MSVLQFLFGFRGRIGRVQYWLVGVVQLLALAGLVTMLLGQALLAGPYSAPASMVALFAIGLGAVTWSCAAIHARRLHDRNKGAIWLLAVFAPAILPYLHPLGWIPSLVMTLWVIVELGFLPGTPGPNRFDTTPTGFDPGRTRQKWPDGPAPQASRSSAASRLASAFSAIESAARNQSQPTPATPRYTAQGPAGAPYGAQSRPGFGQRKPGVFGTKQ